MCAQDAPVASIASGVVREMSRNVANGEPRGKKGMISMTTEEMVAKMNILCNKYYPKCITNECPLAKYYCYDNPNIVDLYRKGSPAVKRKITRILKAVE